MEKEQDYCYIEEFAHHHMQFQGCTLHSSSDVSGLAWAQSLGLGLALVGLGFQNCEPGLN